MRPRKSRLSAGLVIASGVLAFGLLLGYFDSGSAGTASAAESAQEPTTDASAVSDEAVASITEQLNCPTCQGYNLRDCPLTVCAQMREQIRQRVAEGADEQAIIDEFVDYYGPQVLNAPPREGFFLLAWWVPPFALAAGALGLVLWFRRQRGRRAAPISRAVAGDGASGDGGPKASGSGAGESATGDYAAAFERMAGEAEAKE